MALLLSDAIDEPALIWGNSQRPRLRFIDILHPGYGSPDVHDKSNILISLPALDDGGIDYHTAHVACAILVGNRWDAYFSLSADGEPCPIPEDGVLRETSYYFCFPLLTNPPTVPSLSVSPEPYPVVARFSDWRFPHQDLPPIWSRLQESMQDEEEEPRDLNGRCCLSNYCEAVELAHLVPAAQSDWWSKNNMTRYVSFSNLQSKYLLLTRTCRYGPRMLFSSDPINAPANFLPLRSDIHKVFDERHLTFVPKVQVVTEKTPILQKVTVRGRLEHEPPREANNSVSREELGTGGREPSPYPSATSTSKQPRQITTTISTPRLVGHVFNSTPGGQLPKLWHNRSLHKLPSSLSVECLFARFAWTVFSPLVFCDFLYATEKPRRVMIWDRGAGAYKIEEAGPERCRAFFNAARARSESPKKRSRGGDDTQARDCESEAHSFCSRGESDVDSGYHDDTGCEINLLKHDGDEENRGRTRKRRFKEVDRYPC